MVLQNANLLKILGICICKGYNRDGHKLFFRILFDEEAVITYPRDNMLRVSDGKWSTNKVIRVSETGTSDFNKPIGQRMIGVTLGATALIATVIKFSRRR